MHAAGDDALLLDAVEHLAGVSQAGGSQEQHQEGDDVHGQQSKSGSGFHGSSTQ
jgi:hypothetical protein